jgi:hypothetical protein
MDFKEKIKHRTEERDANKGIDQIEEGEKFERSQFFGIDNIRNFPPCIDLRLSDGNSKALPYSFIVEINFQKSEGIELLTTSKRVFINGRNLQRLYDYLILFRVKFIQSNIGKDISEESLLFVKEILVEDL